ncbi:MAG TPA: hypothetical protein VI819_05050 [Patescibacteria group bacterium]|nr:hypothetical protein [Patescibacteria group bacterium]
MSHKRRTRKQKFKAKNRYQESLLLGTKKYVSASTVKSQFQEDKKSKIVSPVRIEKASFTGKMYNLASIKKDLFKSLGLAVTIFVAEMMLYLAWKGN